MREQLTRRAAFQALAQAQAAAIAGIGLRGTAARAAMRLAARRERQRRDEQRWAAISRGASRTGFQRFGEGNLDAPSDQASGRPGTMSDSNTSPVNHQEAAPVCPDTQEG